MKYRADIDGLRAIAVSLVLVYHAGFTFVSGGFIGVGVFFVISGYLITLVIYEEVLAGCFSFQTFYLRRMRRILPALFTVGFVTLIAGYFLLFPSDYTLLAKSFMATVFFVSNFFFWKNTGGYFDSSADELPLLHTWSLAVEEQFYLLWPIIFITLLRPFYRAWRISLTVVVISLSFILAEWALKEHAEAAYYFLPTRAGELLLGALIVFLPKSLDSKMGKGNTEFLSLIALVLILLPAFMLSRGSSFPGINAFWPCLGVALLIFIGRESTSLVHKLLSLKLLVKIGLISYSLYLWHWPIVAFVNYFEIEKIAIVSLLIIFCSVLLSVLSWKYVEMPFRRKQLSFKKALSLMFVFPVLISLAVGSHNINSLGYPGRMAVNGWKDRNGSVSRKECQELDASTYPESCLLGEKQGLPSFAIWGDSFADAFVPSLHVQAMKEKKTGYAFIKHSCPSIYGVLRHEPVRKGITFSVMCKAYTRQTYEFLLSTKQVDTIYLNSAYNWYASASNLQGEAIALATESGEGYERVIEQLVITANMLNETGKRVIILMPHFEPKSYKADVLAYNLLGNERALTYDLTRVLPPHKKLDDLLDLYGLNANVGRLYVHHYICPKPETCQMVNDENDLYLSDGHHISKVAAEKVVPKLFGF